MEYRQHALTDFHMRYRHPCMLMFQNKESVAMLVYRTNPVGVKLFFFFFHTFACVLATKRTNNLCMASFQCNFFFRNYPVPKTKRLPF